MNDIELNRRELTGDDALRLARESGMEPRFAGGAAFLAGVGDLIRFARLVRAGWTPPSTNGVDSSPAQLDVEDLIRRTVPGGSICDPQQVADAIRAYFADGVREDGKC